MATNPLHLNRRAARRLLALAVAAAALGAPGTAGAYGWPLRPFDVQHPVRAFFGDPRIGMTHHGMLSSFHFGIDISAPDGTPVYATVSGRIEVRKAEVVAVHAGSGTVFEYWHVVPTVRSGGQAVAYRTVVGRIARGWEHVHFSERHGSTYVNPLRAGAIALFSDRTKPSIRGFGFERDGTGIGRSSVTGRFDLVVEAADEMPIAAPAPWTGKPVAPAVIRWRVVGRTGPGAWRTAVDFRRTIPSAGLFSAVYARWTRQNKPWRQGRYRFLLARDWNSTAHADGVYRVEVQAIDVRGNRASSSATFTVANRR